jgi:hypothetical protein
MNGCVSKCGDPEDVILAVKQVLFQRVEPGKLIFVVRNGPDWDFLIVALACARTLPNTKEIDHDLQPPSRVRVCSGGKKKKCALGFLRGCRGPESQPRYKNRECSRITAD